MLYQPIYDLLSNLFYGVNPTLTSEQIGSLVFYSQTLTLLCALVPFIILFMIVRRMFD